MKNLLIVHILVLIVILNSCVTKDSPQEETKQTVNSLPLSFGKPEENQQKPIIKVDKKLLQGIPAKELKACLPLSIHGVSMLSPSSGRSLVDGITITKTSAEYVFPKGNMKITYMDYAGQAFSIADRYIIPKNTEIGMDIQKIILPNGSGYSRYSPNEEMLNIYCLLENRVAVEIEANGTEEWFTNQSSIIELIQADCIVNKLKNTY